MIFCMGLSCGFIHCGCDDVVYQLWMWRNRTGTKQVEDDPNVGSISVILFFFKLLNATGTEQV